MHHVSQVEGVTLRDFNRTSVPIEEVHGVIGFGEAVAGQSTITTGNLKSPSGLPAFNLSEELPDKGQARRVALIHLYLLLRIGVDPDFLL